MSQLVTLETAQAIAAKLSEAGLGGGVKPYNPNTEKELNPPFQDTDPHSSGIYIPVYAVGPFATPDAGTMHFYHFRFRNGAEGFNAGLVQATMKEFPTRWPLMIALEVASSAAEARAAQE